MSFREIPSNSGWRMDRLTSEETTALVQAREDENLGSHKVGGTGTNAGQHHGQFESGVILHLLLLCSLETAPPPQVRILAYSYPTHLKCHLFHKAPICQEIQPPRCSPAPCLCFLSLGSLDTDYFESLFLCPHMKREGQGSRM